MAETTTGPRYETAHELSERTGKTDTVVCMDCGVFVMNRAAHDRFHSIGSAQAWALSVLKVGHIGAEAHDRYDIVERIDRKKFDSWSADALHEAIDALAAEERYATEKAENDAAADLGPEA